MKYIPNLNDPRIIKRIKTALGFVRGCMSESKSHAWSTRYIDKHLGRSNNSLGKFLRNHLLIETKSTWSKDSGICKEYKLNLRGYQYIKDLVSYKQYMSISNWSSFHDMKKNTEMATLLENKESLDIYPIVQQVGDSRLVNEWVKKEFKTEFESLDFLYEDKSNRLWHPLQNVRKVDKQNIFSELDLTYQYDIVCCAPTLIHQYSHQVPLVVENDKYIQGPMDLYLFAVQRYLQDRVSVRKQIAQETEIPEKLVKIIINALFAGAQLGKNPTCAIYKLLNGDIARIEYLKQHPYIIELRSDIKIIWEYLRPVMTTRYKTNKLGQRRKLALSSRDKWGLYFYLERQVLNIIKNYLDRTNNKYFLEHDGFTTQVQVNELELLDEIYQKTGFILELDMEILMKKEILEIYPIVQQVGVSR
jgi:hypothetical protein